MQPDADCLFEQATRPFARCGKIAWHTARGKLRHDPAFFAIVGRGLLPPHGRLYDLGCGQGILLALLAAARDEHAAGRWPAGWSAPPHALELHGIELRQKRVAIARRALGPAAQVAQADVRTTPLLPCAAVVILDVLLYLSPAEQQALLSRAVAQLEAKGVLLLREADAGAGLSFHVTQGAERLLQFVRGAGGSSLHYRRASEWLALLRRLGLRVTAERLDQGTPFANMLYIARRPS